LTLVTRRSAAAFVLGWGLSDAAAASPLRVVSLNPCLDTILVHLASRDQIAGLSHYARQPSSSTIAALAETLPFTYETAEEILALRPDMVLASRHSSLATRRALERLGVDVVTFSVPNSVEESLTQIREIAGLVNQSARGASLIEGIGRALAEAEAPRSRPLIKTIIFQPRGLVAGSGTLADEMLRRTGFENVAARYGVQRWGNLSLERLLADPPDLLLSGLASPGARPWAERLLAHRALRAVAGRMRRATFPEACLYCGGPVLLQTAPILARAREAYWSAA
jgi:iron complex transport system substrate-binding protein